MAKQDATKILPAARRYGAGDSTTRELAAPAKAARDIFSSNLGVLLATLGSAVGLGNIWKVPALLGQNGGASFIFVYIIATLIVGLPVMIAELTMGRAARANAITTMQKLSPNKRHPWWLIGVSGVLAAFFILAFYTEVAAWVFAYVFKALVPGAFSTDPAVNEAAFGALVTSPWQSLFWQWVVLAMIGLIVAFGVSNGIERVTKRLMPALFVLLLVVCVRSLTLPGAGEGLSFLFRPDWSALTGPVLLVATGLAFFKLSVGMGCMTTYGSYFKENQNIPMTATRVMLSDLTISILAGIAVFPAVFAFGFEPQAGAPLLFYTIPAVFDSMPFGQFFMVIFFVLTAFAATGAMLSLLEVPVAFLAEKTKMPRVRATVLTVGLLAVFGATAALSNSTLSGVAIFGKSFFDFYDYTTSNVLLPVGGLATAIFIGWVWGYDEVKRELTNQGQLGNERLVRLFFGIAKFVTPIVIVIVLLNGLGIIKLN